ncbi:LOB domain-containing protein 33-like [Primulina huaijiensis]|uniref:LOB domain-containing protein 33-like n=1 Tax=Primulina huaijiensis TaxID=1492673 RepID=UPI003CC76EA7
MTGLGSSCGACKFLRRRCASDCVFAPYFCYEQAATHFSAVHKVFGASNVSKLLLHLPVHSRSDAAITISYEALARMHDPIYGCVAHIFALQQQVASIKEEIEMVGNQMANLGFDMARIAAPHETDHPYFVTQPSIGCDVIDNRGSLQSLPISHWGHESMNQVFCSHAGTLQKPGTENENSQAFLDSSILESLVEELNQDYYLHLTMAEEFSAINGR